MTQPVIAVLMPMARAAHPNTMRCLLQADLPRPYHFLDLVGYPVEQARNMLAVEALKRPEVTHLLWVDDDMTFGPKAVRALLDLDLPIVGGLCFNRRHPYNPVLMRRLANPDQSAIPYGFLYQYPIGLVPVDATGAAFLLTKREVYEKIRPTLAAESSDRAVGFFTNRGHGEDVSFCERAREVGYEVFVDTRVEIGHVGEVVVAADFARRNRFSELNPWSPPTETPDGEPVVSVVIPTYNQKPEYLRAAIASAAAQSVPVEIIVVSDGCTQCEWCGAELRKPCASCKNPECPGQPAVPRLRMIYLPQNAGIAVALNAGVAAMHTDWFVWLSSDDLMDPRKVERQLRATQTSCAKASFHAFRVMDAEGNEQHAGVVTWRTVEEQQKILAHGCAINGSTVMIHRDVFLTVGLFDSNFRYGQDWEFWNRVGQEYLWLPIPELLGTRREHGNLTERLNTASADDPERRRRDDEDMRIRRAYAPRCPHCSGPLP